MTMYKLCQLLNAELARRGSEKRVREQMLYNYKTKGLIKTVDGKCSDQAAAEFITKYADKHAPVAAASK
jgi:hypothetical protein